jgi:hypothetical protein
MGMVENGSPLGPTDMGSMVKHSSLLKLAACMSVIFTVNDYFYIGSQAERGSTNLL